MQATAAGAVNSGRNVEVLNADGNSVNDVDVPVSQGGSTLDEVYEQIMRQKKVNQQQVLPVAASTAPSGSVDLRWAPMQTQGSTHTSQHMVFRSATMEGIRDMIAGGGSLGMEDTMLQWGSLPPERFLEGLANDMKEIGAGPPPDAAGLRTTFTIEKIVSSGEGDLQALVREAVAQGGANGGIPLVGGAGVTSALVEASALHNAQQQQQQQQQQNGVAAGSRSTSLQEPLGAGSGAAGRVLPARSHDTQQHSTPHNQNQQQQQQQQQQQPMVQFDTGRLQGTTSQTSVGLNGPAGGATSMATGIESWGGGGANGGLSSIDLTLASNEAEVLERENTELQAQLDMLLAQVDVLQQDNNQMKALLLETCAANGIHADLAQLNATIAMHRAAPMGDGPATQIASSALSRHNGDVAATIRHLLQVAITRARGNPPAMLQQQQQPQQQQQQPAAQVQFARAGNSGAPVLLQSAGSGTPSTWLAQPQQQQQLLPQQQQQQSQQVRMQQQQGAPGSSNYGMQIQGTMDGGGGSHVSGGHMGGHMGHMVTLSAIPQNLSAPANPTGSAGGGGQQQQPQQQQQSMSMQLQPLGLMGGMPGMMATKGGMQGDGSGMQQQQQQQQGGGNGLYAGGTSSSQYLHAGGSGNMLGSVDLSALLSGYNSLVGTVPSSGQPSMAHHR